MVHPGSRHLGHETATDDQREDYKELKKNHRVPRGLPKDLADVEDRLFDDYLHDTAILQRNAALYRKAVVDVILQEMKLSPMLLRRFTYIDLKSMMLRKSAVSAKKG